MIVTIDGPAGTGKTTVARAVAARLQMPYFDTGAMYRSVTYCLIQRGISFSDEQAIEQFLQGFRYTVEGESITANGEEVTAKIRSQEVTAHVSSVAALRCVRTSLVEIQHAYAEGRDAVFEGRDMGTVVFPDARLKVFLTARPGVRAHRRYLELKAKGEEMSLPEVERRIRERDSFDATRELSPLAPAADAIIVDTSDLEVEQVVERVYTFYQKRVT